VEGRSPHLSEIERLVEEVEHLSLRGRALGSTTGGLAYLFTDIPGVQDLVTRPSEEEASGFDVRLPYRERGLENISDLEYLYGYMIGSENLGLCLFTAFAVLESPHGLEVLARLVEVKTGKKMPGGEIIKEGLQCIKNISEYEKDLYNQCQLGRIPEFIKVLLRYFQNP
jgi:hypothetical protein